MVKLTPKKTVSRRKKIVLVAITMGAGVIAATVAVPTLVRQAEPEPASIPATAPRSAGAQEPAPSSQDEADEPATEAPVEELVPTLPDGDLSVEFDLGEESFAHGTPIGARMTLVNHDDQAFHVPAAGESHAHVELVVVDDAGNEVRRVAEERDDTLPRHTLRIDPGHRRHFPVHVVAEGEEPLPPGRYAVHVEVAADPHWRRTGLRTWQAPGGRLRSPAVLLDVVGAE